MLNRKKGKSDKLVKVVGSERLISVTQSSPLLLQAENLTTMGSIENEPVHVLVGSDAFTNIDRHAKSDTSQEVGGFLVGRPFEWKGQTYVEIVDAFIGEVSSSSAVHWTISHRTWIHAQSTVREQFPGLHIVGWYHTHPNMSVFFSTQDYAIHEGFFRELWHVALVLEPSSREAGFFIWDEQFVREASGYQVVYPLKINQEDRWRIPTLRKEQIASARELMVEEFYEIGCWHTRWEKPDDVIVKVQKQAVDQINSLAFSGSDVYSGLCLGRTITNPNRVGPRLFIEVKEIQPVKSGLIFNLLKKMKQKMFGESPLGICLLVPNSTPLVPGWYEKFRPHLKLDNNLILLIFDETFGLDKCAWFTSGGEFVERKLVEMIDLTAKKMEYLGEIIDKVESAYENISS